jgi:tRNA (guanine-N7-)-methyltransferase
MPRQKMNRYDRINNDSRVVNGLQHPHEIFIDEKKHYNSITLELACGRGEYSVWLAPHFSDRLFVGIDAKGDRIGVWVDNVHQAWLQNVRFVCGIIHHLDKWFLPESVDEIWIVHPDPRPRDRDIKRRLTYPRFLELYDRILKPWWLIKLKTDDKDLFLYSMEQLIVSPWDCIKTTTDLYNNPDSLQDHYGIQTHYEKLALAEGRQICYGVWRKR